MPDLVLIDPEVVDNEIKMICASYEVLFMKHIKAVYDNKGVKRDKTYQREKKETATQNCEFPIYFRSENCFSFL
jgi:hypothetical protein